MAELVGDHALQFVAREHGHCAAGDRDSGVARGMAGGERVDPRLAIHYVDLRDGDAGGDRHFFDNVEELPFVRIGRIRIDQAAIE